jgi:hypothetical protein
MTADRYRELPMTLAQHVGATIVLTSGMDRGTILDHLALALRRVAEGELHIAQQHEIIASLERHGLDASPLKAALLLLEELQGMLIDDRDRLKNELDENSN